MISVIQIRDFMLKTTIDVIVRSLLTSAVLVATAFVFLLATNVFLNSPHAEPPAHPFIGVIALYITACAPLALVLYFLKGKSAAVIPFVLFATLLLWAMTFRQGMREWEDSWYTLLIWNASWFALLLSFVLSAVKIVRNKINWFTLSFWLSLPLVLLLTIKVMDPKFVWFLIPVFLLFVFNGVIEYGCAKGHHGASGIPLYGGMIAMIGAFMYLPYWWALLAPLFLWFDFNMCWIALFYKENIAETPVQVEFANETLRLDAPKLTFKENLKWATQVFLWIAVTLFFLCGAIYNKIQQDDRRFNQVEYCSSDKN